MIEFIQEIWKWYVFIWESLKSALYYFLGPDYAFWVVWIIYSVAWLAFLGR